MNKTELVEALADHAGIPKAAAGRFLDAFVNTVENVLKGGEQVSIPSFGTFSVGNRAARVARNPRTGELMQLAATRVPKFKAGKGLKEIVQKENE